MGQDAALLEKARDAAVEAASAAARVIRLHAGRIDPGSVRNKGTQDLVTQVDEEAQRIIVATLGAAFPAFGVLGEEGADLARAETEAEGYRWIIDPIDGTTNFLHGAPPFAVSIGLQHGAEMVVGVVLEVTRGELFAAVRGGGLYVNGVRAQVSQSPSLHDSLVTTGFPYRALDHLEAYLDVFRTLTVKTRGIRRPGSAATDLAYVAAGRFDAFYETGLAPWDAAAGQVLVEEAGGRVTDYDGARNPAFSGEIVASNGLVHDEMLEAVEPLRAFHRSRA